MNKQLLLEKYIKVAVKKALQEQEEQQRKAEKAMYLVYRFPGLKKVIEGLMSPVFGNYVNNISITAPKPTTFKVELTNHQNFFVKYLGKGHFNIKIAGKKYNPANLGELERAAQSIADLLELNYAPEDGKNQASGAEKGGAPGPEAASLAADLSGPESVPLTPDMPPTGETSSTEPIPPTSGETPPEEEEETPLA